MARNNENAKHSADTTFAIDTQRQDYLAMPAKARAERLEYVRQLLAAERERGQVQPSWLMRHARDIFGELL